MPSDHAAAELLARMNEFYSQTTTYTAFDSSHDEENIQKPFHDLMLPSIRKMLRSDRKLKILEYGAGRPTLPKNLGDLRSQVEYHAQDVTASNRGYLATTVDQHFIGDLSEVTGSYDVVFSTFVLEHVTTPRATLELVKKLVAPGGMHIIFCPRYDMPGYICPSLRHLPAIGRLWATTFLTASRLKARIDRRARFWVNCDPAVFHRPWYRDADAVHLVSRFDVETWHRENGFEVTRLQPPVSGLRDWISKRCLILSLQCTRRADA